MFHDKTVETMLRHMLALIQKRRGQAERICVIGCESAPRPG